MNKDLSYEQQVKGLLHHYDQLVEENEALKARIKEMEDERAEYGNPKELREMLKTLPAKMNYLRSIYKDRDQRLNWAKKKLVKYLRSKGEKVPTGITFTSRRKSTYGYNIYQGGKSHYRRRISKGRK